MAELNWKRGRTDAGIRVDDELVAADLVAVLPHPRRREGEQHGRTAAAPQSESEPNPGVESPAPKRRKRKMTKSAKRERETARPFWLPFGLPLVLVRTGGFACFIGVDETRS